MNKYCKECKHLYNTMLDYCPKCKDPNSGIQGFKGLFAREVDTIDYYNPNTKRWGSQL